MSIIIKLFEQLNRKNKNTKKKCNDKILCFVHENNKLKITDVRKNCIVKIKIMNKIQCITIYKSHVTLLYIYLKIPRIKKQNGRSTILFFYYSTNHVTCVIMIG